MFIVGCRSDHFNIVVVLSVQIFSNIYIDDVVLFYVIDVLCVAEV